jgi:hypothetical protein
MKRAFRNLVSGSALALIGFSTQAFFIDFTDADYWADANYETSFTSQAYNGPNQDFFVGLEAFNNVPYLFRPKTSLITSTVNDGCSAVGFECDFDGIGIKTTRLDPEKDEIGFLEWLTVSFYDANMVMGTASIDTLYLFDLDSREDGVLTVHMNGSETVVDFEGDGADDFYTLTVEEIGDSFTLKSSGLLSNYALAGLDISAHDGDLSILSIPVPEPGVLALFGIGLIGAGAARRNRKV